MPKVKGIKALCGDTKSLTPEGYAPRYMLQVHVNKRTGELTWADVVGTNNYIQYNDPDWIFLFNIKHPTTMAGIKAMIQMSDKAQHYNLTV